MERSWIFLINPFTVATNSSYRKAKQLGDYTLAALTAAAAAPGAPPNFAILIGLLTPSVTAYDAAYEIWLSQQGAQKGQSKNLKDLLDELRSEKIEAWDLAIQNVYRQNTPQYMALLPRHRVPFQTGTQQQRIAAVGALGLSIGSIAALAAIKTEVDDFHDALVLANSTQKGSKTTTDNNSADVEAKRLTLCTALYGVLGELMALYRATPETAGNFFLLEALRDRAQTSFRSDVNGGDTILAFIRTLDDGDQVKIINRGNTALQTALVPEKNDAMPATALTIAANQEETVVPAALGAQGNRFLIVKNVNATEAGAYTIELL